MKCDILHHGILFRCKNMKFIGKQMELENVVLSGVAQLRKTNVHSLICDPRVSCFPLCISVGVSTC